MVTLGEVRTFGDVLLNDLYSKLGGTGTNSVNVDAFRATQLVTGDKRPSKEQVRNLRNLLYIVADNPTARFKVRKSEEEGRGFVLTVRPTGKPNRRANHGVSA